ncbi:hypothetical protein HCA58_07895 [Micromonospora sp. HNM0581]|uniref:hypothetical protein n=1 Tax=Micromonospora sp. HNM0581 TaxID=2716341 RepID=UPI00146C5F2F|nr:hypothetical protein [Micromonospora sp. HNM0581]NLU78304.1 hypothetical protein [Micromonospora sp. HNM0581]
MSTIAEIAAGLRVDRSVLMGGTLLVQGALAAAGEGDERAAAHLIDAARAHLHAHDPTSAARTLLQAQSTAPAEVRHRPAARDLLAQVLGCPDTPTTIVQLAAALGVPAT